MHTRFALLRCGALEPSRVGLGRSAGSCNGRLRAGPPLISVTIGSTLFHPFLREHFIRRIVAEHEGRGNPPMSLYLTHLLPTLPFINSITAFRARPPGSKRSTLSESIFLLAKLRSKLTTFQQRLSYSFSLDQVPPINANRLLNTPVRSK